MADKNNEGEALVSKYPPKKIVPRRVICKAMCDLEDLHPLRKTVSWHHVAGCCKVLCCCAKKKKPFAQALKLCILGELELTPPEENLNEPYLLLGYGINAYFDILQSVSHMFFWATIFAIPIFYIYGVTGSYFKDMKSYPISRWFAGNFGGSNMFCKQARLSLGKMEIQCPSGTVLETDKGVMGVISNEFASFTYCQQPALDPVLQEKGHQNCTANMSPNARTTMKKEMFRKCRRKEKCSLSFENVIAAKTPAVRKACDDEAYLFVQVPCIIPSEDLTIRKVYGLAISCIGVWIYLFVHVTVEYIKSIQGNAYVEWDVKTCSAADYTVEFRIHPEMYEYFQEKYLDETNPISEIGQFRTYVKDEMESRLTEFPALGIDGPEGDEMPVKIAIITFAFNNAEIIHNLRRRGTLIAGEKWPKYEKLHKKMSSRLANSQELLDQMQTPVACFMTLETEEGKCRADLYNETVLMEDYAHYRTFLGSEIDVGGASEPTDIIWENRHFTTAARFTRTLIVSFIVFLMLCVSFALIYTAQKTSLAMKQKYPKQNCNELNEEYKGRRNAWMRDSINEFLINNAIEEKGEVALYTGPMQCFCVMEKKLKHKKAEVYEIKDADGKVTVAEPICLKYRNDQFFSKMLALSITVIIIVINTILKLCVVKLVGWIGEDTVSQQKGSVVKGAFLGQFFNTGFIILIVNANMQQFRPKKFWKAFNGPFSDYMPQWYMDVGLKVVTTFLVQGLMPYINVVKESIILKMKGRVDTKCSGDPFRTGKRTLQKYKSVYLGKDMPIHFLYSNTLNITFLAMLYGLGMPIMLPMASIIIANQRLAERIQVAYNYRQPPAMDNSLSDSVLSIMKYAPIMLLFNGYWLMDNRQFFDNVWHYKDKVTENMWADHFPEYRVCQSSPLLLMSMTCVALIVVQIVIPAELLLKWGFTMSQDELEVDEDLPNFFTALMLTEADKIICENRQMMTEFGFELSESWLIEKLENTKWPEKSIQGTPWYAIMCNPIYVEGFAWLGPHVKDRNLLIKDCDDDPDNNYQQSDIVSVMMNLGSIPDFVASKINLGPTFCTDFMGLMDEYKRNFEEEHGVKWDFSNQKLLDRYVTFKRTRESFQREYADDGEAKEGGSIEMRRFKRF